MKTILGNKGYMTLMAAQTISSVGDWLSMVAVITMVGMKWNASPMEVSLVILCLALPMALFGPLAGTVADRLDRRKLMLFSDIIRAILILVLAVANSIWIVYITLFSVGVFSAVFIPAKNGKLKELVGESDMKQAMSITSMIDSSTKIVGPLLSGILVTAFGAQVVFYIDSSTFLLSAILLFFLPKTLHNTAEQKDRESRYSFKAEFLVGISFVKSNYFILVGLFLLGTSLLILQLSDSQIIVLIRELSQASPDLFGYVVTAAGIGTFLSGAYLIKKTDYNSLPYMLIGVLGIGLSFGAMGILTYYDVALSTLWSTITGLLAGFSAGLIFVPFQAAVQVDTPVDMTGRVFGVVNSVTTTATIVGPLLGGWLSTIIGVIPTFIITASLLIVISLIGFLTRSTTERSRKDVSESQQGAHRATSK
ncbi:MFS transporter [Aquibacillus kalidii]|uniref:MFS transporter n=1 Tax=Aquibacillus kalidii TaxID=2762597 RepID=UPI0016461065|nr:MFS transporter [Aquibacillus kalidii]